MAQEDLARLVKPSIDLGAIHKLLAVDSPLASLQEKRRGLLASLADRNSGIPVRSHCVISPGLKGMRNREGRDQCDINSSSGFCYWLLVF